MTLPEQPSTSQARSFSSDDESTSLSSSDNSNRSYQPEPVVGDVAEGSSRSAGGFELEAEPDLSWVSVSLRGHQSGIKKGSSDEASLSAEITSEGWKVQGMKRGEDIATWTADLKFTMYRIVFQRMGIVPPFTRFQRMVLKYLQVAPSQLNPNAWAFLQCYERVLGVLNRPVSVRLFFILFEMSYLNEPGSKGARKEAVSFKNRSRYNLFKPYMDSLPTGWKKDFFWVVPRTTEALRGVARMADNFGGTPLFPFVWSYEHFMKKPGQYAFDEDDLDDLDRGTIHRLKRIASLVPGGRIKVKNIVDARDRVQVEAALVDMADLQDFDLLEQWTAEDTEASPGRGGPESHAEATPTVVVVADSPRQEVPLNSPIPTPGPPSKRGRSSETGRQEKKKKSRSSRSHGPSRSPRLDLLGLSDEDCARFKEAPFEVVAEMMKAAGTLFRKYQEEETDRLEGRRLAQKFSLLEDDLIDKNFKLNSALSLLAEVREERDRLLQRVQELEPQVEAVAEVEKKLREAEGQVVAAATARAEAEAARDRALAERSDFEKEVGRLTSDNAGLASDNADLSARVSSLQNDLSVMEQEKSKYEGRYKEVLGRAKGAAEAQFGNAVNQMKLLHPGLEIDPQVVCSSHRVVGQEIVRPAKVVKGQVVEEAAVIFHASPDT